MNIVKLWFSGLDRKNTRLFALRFFFYWYAIKPATPFTKMYSVFRCSNFNDIGGDKGIRTPGLYDANVSRYHLRYIP